MLNQSNSINSLINEGDPVTIKSFVNPEWPYVAVKAHVSIILNVSTIIPVVTDYPVRSL